ncbi:unnamed protein product [Larinioides sclopetarius]|uniref:Uncharacterized protein n=1 Tax=Larinioides sclopetarius TaxID=280406 RepID=A0AAV2AJE4_9ARAC
MRFYFLLALAVCIALLVAQAEGMEPEFLRGARKIRQADGGDTANIEICLLNTGLSLAQVTEIIRIVTGAVG